MSYSLDLLIWLERITSSGFVTKIGVKALGFSLLEIREEEAGLEVLFYSIILVKAPPLHLPVPVHVRVHRRIHRQRRARIRYYRRH